MIVVSIKEQSLIVDRGGAAYVGELGRGFYPSISIHITRRCVMDYPFQWEIMVEILELLLGLVHNYGWREEFSIILGKYK